MDGGPQPLRFRFPAQPHQLRVRDVHLAAVPHAAAGEDLDHVGPISLEGADPGAQLLFTLGAGNDLRDRGEDPRPDDGAGRHRVPHALVFGAAKGLHGGEAGQQHLARIVEDGVGAVRRGDVPLVEPSIRPEVPVQVHVHVDEPRHQRAVAEIDGHRPRALIDGGDLRAANLDDAIGDDGTAAVEHPCRPDGGRLLSTPLPERGRRREGQANGNASDPVHAGEDTCLAAAGCFDEWGCSGWL